MTLGAHPERKRIRLPTDAYLLPGSAWLVTIGTQGRAAVFADAVLAGEVMGVVRDRCAARGAILDAFCLMPDHAHLLLQVRRSGLVDVVGDVKSNATRVWWRRGGNGALWQRSFHDRGIRDARDYERAAVYVLENPVRAGLMGDWGEYPFVGGALVDGAGSA